MRISPRDGFSLMELVIVLAFVSILTAIAIPNYLNFQKRAKAAESKANLGAIRTSLTAYFAEYNNFNVGSIGTLTYDETDNTGTPFGSSLTAQGGKRRWVHTTPFSVAGFTAEGAVYFNYSLEVNNLSGTSARFTAMASADFDKNGKVSHYWIHDDPDKVVHSGSSY